MAEGGESAIDVFGKVLTKLSKILGREPPFTIVTAELNAKGLIADGQLSAVKRQGLTNDQRGNEVAEKLKEKIGDSDNPNECLLKICDVFESDTVDYPTLKDYGAKMRKSISNQSRQTSGVNKAKKCPPRKFAVDDETDGPQASKQGHNDKSESSNEDEPKTKGKSPSNLPDDGEIYKPDSTKNFKEIERFVKDVKILLAPATEGEEQAVLRYLKPINGDKYFRISIYGHKVSDIYIGKYGKYPVVVVKTAPSQHNQGPVHAAIVITKMLEIFTEIKYIVGVGVCYGMNKGKQKLGEVIISTILCDFTNMREGLERYQRSAQPSVGLAIKNIFELTEEIREKLQPKSIIVNDGIYICTPSLIDNDQIKEEYKNIRIDAKAGEMEGAGLVAATEYTTKTVEAIVIKGIGDWGDDDKDATKTWKPFAAHAAAYYIKTVLETKTISFD